MHLCSASRQTCDCAPDRSIVLKPVDQEPRPPEVEASPWQRAMRLAGPVVACLLIGAAGWVLWGMIEAIDPADVLHALVTMPTWRIVACFLLTGLGLIALAGYDMLAVRVVRSSPPLSQRRAAVGSVIANIFANALGLPLLSGGSARWRIYSMGGATLPVVGRIIAMSWVTMWSGILFVLGCFLTISPENHPAVLSEHWIDRVVGVAMLTVLAGFLYWIGRRRRAMRVGGWTIRLPGVGIAVGMILAGAADLVTAAGALWVLLPPDVAPDLSLYIVTYTVGLVAGIAASTPGGIGVFEAAIVTGLSVADRPDVAAALILFRLIYFVVPLIFALALFAIVEIHHRRRLALRRRLGLGTDGLKP